ncbi:MAG TPA: cobalamin-binding protein [Thermoanaerobaculia bacterium]|jgi:iron complex transport system substrate-binding protein
MTARQKRLLHYWVCIPGALLFALWILSGAAMVYDSIRGGLHVFPKPKSEGDLWAVTLAPAALTHNVAGTVERINLMKVGGRPYAQVSTPEGTSLVDAATGRVLSPIDAATARTLLAGYEGIAPLRVDRITSRGYEYKYGELPAWRGVFPNGRIIHIAASSGDVQSWSDREGMIIRAMYYWFHAFQFTESSAANAAIGFVAIGWALLSVVSGLLLYRRGSSAAAAVLLLLGAGQAGAATAPKRIVTLAPSCGEMVAGLGLGDAIVGVTEYTDWPARAKTLPKVGSYVQLNIEAIVALKPNLVIATDDGNPPATLRRLERAGLRVVTLTLRDFAGIQQSMLRLGAITGRTAEARRAVAEMTRVADCVAARTRTAKKPRVLFAYQLAPIVSAGKGTFTTELLAMAGADSITANVAQSYPRLTSESIVASAPEVIVVSSMSPETDAERWRNWLNRWSTIPAVKNRRVHMIDSTNIDRPSQRIVHGLTLLARTIHPTLFARGECKADLP